MKTQLLLIPKVSINPNSIALYHEVDWTDGRPVKRYNPEMNAVLSSKAEHLQSYSRTAEGKVSATAKRKMNKALNYLLLVTNQKTITNHYNGRNFKFKIAFITLTLPGQQQHNDNTIKNKCLNQLIIEIKQHYKVKNYIWRAEKQKNGNIHFHILVDKFIPHQELRDRWNRIIEKLNYITNYRTEQQNWHSEGFKPRPELYKTWPKKKQYESYLRNSKLHWNSPNSTDIHSVWKIKNIKNYISKYLTKQEIEKNLENNPNNHLARQKGRIWACNRELSQTTGLNIIPSQDLEKEIEEIKNNPSTRIYSHPYFTILYFPFDLLRSKETSELLELFRKYLFEKLNFNWQFEIAA